MNASPRRQKIWVLLRGFATSGLMLERAKIYFMTRNISGGYDNILDGLDNDPEVKVYGYLRIPEGTEGKIPAVVFIHGSGGQSPKHLVWIYA